MLVRCDVLRLLFLELLLERFLFRYFYNREHLDQVLLTFALILLFEEFRSLLVGNDFHSVPIPAALNFSVPITGAFSYAAYRFVVIGVCLCLAAALFYWIERTRMGAIIRAAAEKPEMVEVLEVRDATQEELAHGHVHGPGGHQH